MTARSFTLAATALTWSFAVPHVSLADEPIPVVATFSILGDMVQQIGGEHIALTTLVGRDGDAHVYQPTPQAARAVAGADILFLNGLAFEGWLERLAEAAAFDGALVVATTGIDPIAFDEDDHHGHGDHDDHSDHDDHDDHAKGDHDGHDDHDDHAEGEHDDHGDHDEHAGHDHGVFDPHAWLSPTLAVTYVDNITAALAKADPTNASTYYENRAAYVTELNALNAEITEMMAALSETQRSVVTSHDAFGYFARDFGLTFSAPQGLSTESEASAQDVAALIEKIREEEISAVFVENVADGRLLEQIARETGATIGGTLYPGALSEETGPAATYIDLVRHNARTLAEALGQ